MAQFMASIRLRRIALIMALLLPACASVDRNIGLAEQVVTPVAAGEATDVVAYDLAQSMLRAGFSREEILKHGPALRNALATAGGAQLRRGTLIEALFAIHSDRLYVSSRLRGTFVRRLGWQGEAEASDEGADEPTSPGFILP